MGYNKHTAALLADWICVVANTGYSQKYSKRWRITKPEFDNPSTVDDIQGDTVGPYSVDCSAMVYLVSDWAGADLNYSTGSANTNTMAKDFTAAGFSPIKFAQALPLQEGDILWKKGHTAVWDGSRIAEAYSDERGDIAGDIDGDQYNDTDHGETRLSPYRDGWELVYRMEEKMEPYAITFNEGAIVELGSNGISFEDPQRKYACAWKKYADGTLECDIRDYFAGGSSRLVHKNHAYINKYLLMPSEVCDLAPAFVSAPTPDGCMACSEQGWIQIQFERSASSATQLHFWAYDVSGGAVPDFDIAVHLVGRWK